MWTLVRSKQSEPCERTAEREVSMLENNFALFVYSKPCANFVLWISFTLFTHIRTTLKLLKSWTNSSTRESGHHQPKLLWKEIGLNVDTSPKQAVGTMRKNCRTRSLAAWKQPCAFCELCPLDFIHTFYSHSYNSQAIRQVSRTSPDKTALKRNRSQRGQQSEASSRNDAKELRNAKSRSLKTTLHFLCTQNLAQTLCS